MKAAGLAVALSVIAFVPAPSSREVAVTFDDLPVAGVVRRDVPASRELTATLLRAITAHHVPVVGFVNESKLAGDHGVDPARIGLLKMWLDAGLELGNHTAICGG